MIALSTQSLHDKADHNPATYEEKDEFRLLFSLLGVYPDGNPVWCPWHPDREGQPGKSPQKSLSVNWENCTFYCHSPRCRMNGRLEKLRVVVYNGLKCSSNPLSITGTTNKSNIPIPHKPPLYAWVTAPVPTKRCGMAIHLRHREERRRQRILGVLCGCWDCSVCGPYLKEKWRNHLHPLISDKASVQFSVISKQDWQRIYRRIRRAGGEFVKIELQDGYLVILTTADEGVPLPQSIRSGILNTVINAATFNHKSISTSRGWALPKDDEHDKQWERVSALSISVDEAREVVRELGLKPREIPLSTTQKMGMQEGFDVWLPENWLDDGERGFRFFSSGWRSAQPGPERGHHDAPAHNIPEEVDRSWL